MASKYIQKFPIPEGFPEILHDLSKEILRNQPEDILDFCAEYFKCLQEQKVLDYKNKGQNIPCDFKTEIPKISERPQRKKPLNDRDEALHAAAVEKSADIAKKPMTPDQKLLQADSLKSETEKRGSKHSAQKSGLKEEEENLVINLKGDSKAYENSLAAANAHVANFSESHEKEKVNVDGDLSVNKDNYGDVNGNNEEKEKDRSVKEILSNASKRENVGSAKGSLRSESKLFLFFIEVFCFLKIIKRMCSKNLFLGNLKIF